MPTVFLPKTEPSRRSKAQAKGARGYGLATPRDRRAHALDMVRRARGEHRRSRGAHSRSAFTDRLVRATPPPRAYRDRSGRWRDRRGRFLPADPYERQHILDSEAELRHEGLTWGEVDALRSPAHLAEAYRQVAGAADRAARQFQYYATAFGRVGQTFNAYVSNNWIDSTTATQPMYYATTAGTANTSQIYMANNQFVDTGTGSNVHVYTMPAHHVQAEIPFRLLDESGDPDAILGETYQELLAELEGLLRTMPNTDTENVWRSWTVTAGGREDYEREVQVVGLDAVWGAWSENTREHVGPHSTFPRRWVPPSPEERARRTADERRRISVRRTRERVGNMRRRIGERRARRLLLSCLTDEQRHDLETRDGFKVQVGERTYWVSKGMAGNVYLLDADDRRVRSYCIHANVNGMPDEDHMLNQKLLLETDEASFLRIANMTDRSHYARPLPAPVPQTPALAGV